MGTIARYRPPLSTSGPSRFPSTISTGVLGATRSRFSRASAAARGDCSTATIFSNCPSTASASAMQPEPVPISAIKPPLFGSRFLVFASTRSTKPSVSGRGISARGSIFRSKVRNPTVPATYANGTPRLRSATAFQKRSTTSGAASKSRLSQTSAGLSPETAAQSAVASRSSRSPFAFVSSSVMRRNRRTSDTRPLLFLCFFQCGDQLVEPAVHDFIDDVRRGMDSVIGDAALRKVVGPDFLGPIAGADLSAPVTRARRLLLGNHPVEQTGPQNFHGLDLVLQL